MADVVQLKQPISNTEADRQRFEKWAGSTLPNHEATSLLARSKGGDYVNRVARGAWAAWQARGLCIIAAGKNSLAQPRDRVLAVEAAVRAICEQTGGDPAEGTMMLLTAAAHLAMIYADKPMDDLQEPLATALGNAMVAANYYFSIPNK